MKLSMLKGMLLGLISPFWFSKIHDQKLGDRGPRISSVCSVTGIILGVEMGSTDKLLNYFCWSCWLIKLKLICFERQLWKKFKAILLLNSGLFEVTMCSR